MTTGQWLELWLSEKSKGTGASAGGRQVATTTARSYRSHLDLYLVPQLGRIPLTKLAAEDISAAYDRIQVDRPKMGPATLARVHATLGSALGRAIKTRRIGYNPATHVDLPAAKRPKVKPWEPAELGKFLDHVVTDRHGPIFETIAAGGLRRGEALGLRWSDVDLESGILTVRQQLLDVRAGEPKFGAPKSEAGEDRLVELDGHTVDVLRARRFACDLERDEWREAYEDHDLVFAQENGRPYDPAAITKSFTSLVAKAGVRRVRLHDLRHGAASLMLAAGVPVEIVSKRLGHSSLAITLDTYSHLLEGVGRDAAERAQALVPRTGRLPAVTRM